ncbi:MAG: hypothetical protein AAGE94_04525 [Acidobacteriota bacterium]
MSIAVVGSLFYLARAPLAAEFGLDRLETAIASIDEPVETEATPAPIAAPIAPTADPGEATVRQVDPQWNLPRVQASVKAGGEAVEALIPQARDELRQLARLDDPDPVRADRAKRQFDTWGRTWINRLRAIAKDVPTKEDCAVHVSMAPKCKELRLALAEAVQASRETSLDGAAERLDGTAERLDRMLRPPPPEELDDDGDEESTADESA